MQLRLCKETFKNEKRDEKKLSAIDEQLLWIIDIGKENTSFRIDKSKLIKIDVRMKCNWIFSPAFLLSSLEN